MNAREKVMIIKITVGIGWWAAMVKADTEKVNNE